MLESRGFKKYLLLWQYCNNMPEIIKYTILKRKLSTKSNSVIPNPGGN